MSQVNVIGADEDTTEVTSSVPAPSAPVGAADDAAPSSILSRLRQRAEAQREEKFIDMPVGGDFGDMLQIRYKPLKPEEMDAFVAGKTDAQLQQQVALTMDMMARSCVGIYSWDPDDNTKVELRDGGQPMYLDNRLANMLELPQPGGVPMTSREIISCLFGYNGAAIAAHGNRLAEWMQDPKALPPQP